MTNPVSAEQKEKTSVELEAVPMVLKNTLDVPSSSRNVPRRNTLEYHPDRYNISAAAGVKILIIINNVEFKTTVRSLDRRNGSDEDVTSIRKTFTELGWKVEEDLVMQDPTKDQIEEQIKIIQSSTVKISCIAVFIMSHGEENDTIWADDQSYNLCKDVVEQLSAEKCPSLAGKPKMVFVQACQGGNTDSGTSVKLRSPTKKQDFSDAVVVEPNTVYKHVKIPSYADIFVFKASYNGYRCFRSDEGSWFMQTLCRVIDESSADMDLFSIALKVTAFVSMEKVSSSDDKKIHEKKQVPKMQSTLMRKIYLKEPITHTRQTVKALETQKPHSFPTNTSLVQSNQLCSAPEIHGLNASAVQTSEASTPCKLSEGSKAHENVSPHNQGSKDQVSSPRKQSFFKVIYSSLKGKSKTKD
ncbi:caspase-7 [Eurytemora carolleeae]|uniref:caspase-7 n=1 Tax=Eurytemora carolleeae TaxID=1294199 RepID=UPI000C7822D4|nr:caspase-7 [Eurytemora carolleeae]|eukprot:XP_023340596.1 caspase-7-like [Eurytemora affinis]